MSLKSHRTFNDTCLNIYICTCICAHKVVDHPREEVLGGVRIGGGAELRVYGALARTQLAEGVRLQVALPEGHLEKLIAVRREKFHGYGG